MFFLKKNVSTLQNFYYIYMFLGMTARLFMLFQTSTSFQTVSTFSSFHTPLQDSANFEELAFNTRAAAPFHPKANKRGPLFRSADPHRVKAKTQGGSHLEDQQQPFCT
jgi:hypothetical protein